MRLSDREEQVLEVVATRVRVARTDQLLALLGRAENRPSRQRLRKLVGEGWLASFPARVRRLPVSGPLASWSAGEPPPDMESLSRILTARSRKTPVTVETLFQATSKTRGIFGGVEHPIKPDELSHDLAVTELFLRTVCDHPERIPAWTLEDIAARLIPKKAFQKCPDVLLLDEGIPFLALEIGGEYPPAKLVNFHLDLAARNLPYEVY